MTFNWLPAIQKLSLFAGCLILIRALAFVNYVANDLRKDPDEHQQTRKRFPWRLLVDGCGVNDEA